MIVVEARVEDDVEGAWTCDEEKVEFERLKKELVEEIFGCDAKRFFEDGGRLEARLMVEEEVGAEEAG